MSSQFTIVGTPNKTASAVQSSPATSPTSSKGSPKKKRRVRTTSGAQKAILKNLTPRSKIGAKRASKYFRVRLATRKGFPGDDDRMEMVLDSLTDGMDDAERMKRFMEDDDYKMLMTKIVCELFFI